MGVFQSVSLAPCTHTAHTAMLLILFGGLQDMRAMHYAGLSNA
jgi:hypothetical protein